VAALIDSHPDRAEGRSRRLIRTWPMALAAVALLVLSLPAFLRPLLADMPFYAHIADKLLNGGRLYQDALDTKPPFIFLHYAIVFRLFGENNASAVKAITMLFVGTTAWLMVRIRRSLAPGDSRPELVALLFVLASFSGWGEDFLSSNTEILANLFIVAGVYGLVADDFAYRAWRLLLAGAAIGIACLYRFQSGGVVLAYLLLLAARPTQFRSTRIRRAVWLGAGLAVPVAGLVAWYAAVGALAALRSFVMVDYFYVSRAEFYGVEFAAQVGIVVASQIHFLVLSAWQAARILRSRTRTTADVFTLLFAAWSVLGFFVGGHYFAHYIVQSIPAFVLLSAQWLAAPPDLSGTSGIGRVRTLYGRHVRRLLVAHVAIFTAINTVYYWPPAAPIDSYSALTQFVRANTTKRDPVFVWTGRTWVLFGMDRVFATRFVSKDLLIGRLYGSRHRLPTETAAGAWPAAVLPLWPLLMADLRANPPPIVVDDAASASAFTIDHYPELQAFVTAHYSACRPIESFCVYLRTDTERPLPAVP
jgi:hypothetical protein